MKISYKTEKLMKELSDKKITSLKYGPNTFAHLNKFRSAVNDAESFDHLRIRNRSFQIHKKLREKNIFIAYLNKQWRLEFNYTNQMASIITIYRVHPHKYK